MGIERRINLVVLIVFVLGLGIGSAVDFFIERRGADQDIALRAQLLMQATKATRQYTAEFVDPALQSANPTGFLPQTVPSFAAATSFKRLTQAYPEYHYREATLDPTNPADRAESWEVDIINSFVADPAAAQRSGLHQTESGPVYYLANPIRVTDQSCMQCHSTPQAAPQAMLAHYGSANGFGWRIGETVGAQIVTVPVAAAASRAFASFLLFALLLASVFILVLGAIMVMTRRTVVGPLRRLSDAADTLSREGPDGPELPVDHPVAEINRLARAINRLHRSIGVLAHGGHPSEHEGEHR